MRIFERIVDRMTHGICLNNIGTLYYRFGDYCRAIEYHKRALKIMEEVGNVRGQANTFSNMGLLYDRLGDYPQAFDYYHRALAINVKIGNRMNQGIALNNIGFAFYHLGDYPRAMDYLQRSLVIRKAIGNRRGEGITLNNIGMVFAELKDYEKSLACLIAAQKIGRELREKENLLRVELSLGKLELALGHTESSRHKAFGHAARALKLAGEMNLKSDRAQALLLQARILSTDSPFKKGGLKGDFNKYFKEAISIFKGLKQPFDLARAYYYYAECSALKTRESSSFRRDSGPTAPLGGTAAT